MAEMMASSNSFASLRLNPSKAANQRLETWWQHHGMLPCSTSKRFTIIRTAFPADPLSAIAMAATVRSPPIRHRSRHWQSEAHRNYAMSGLGAVQGRADHLTRSRQPMGNHHPTVTANPRSAKVGDSL